MFKKNYKRVIYLLLVIVWMTTVFTFSNQKGEESQKTSSSITKLIVQIITYNKNLTESEQKILIEKTDFIIRKCAHFSLYALGGVLIYNYINTYYVKQNKKICISIILGIIFAITDEFHQFFISGRSAQILDVCIDSLGIVVGVILIKLLKKQKPLYN